jgi:hypothetical protein
VDESTIPLPDTPDLLPPPTPTPSPWRWLVAALAVVGVAVVAYVRYQEGRFLALSPSAQVRELWGRLIGRADQLGHGPAAGQTPNEFAADLAADLDQRVLHLGPLNLEGGQARQPLETLAKTYTATIYSPDPLPTPAAYLAQTDWGRLRRLLWLLRWRKTPTSDIMDGRPIES